MVIIVDDREPEGYRKLFDRVQRLPRGDYWVMVDSARLICERKTISDFWNSLKKGRLHMQIQSVDLILLEHRWVPRKEFRWDRFYDVVNGINVHGPPVVWVRNPVHLQKTLRRYEERIRRGEWGMTRKPLIMSDEKDPELAILAALPGVGVVRARSILSHYGSWREAIANVERWHEVDGVGPVTVRKVLQVGK